VKRNLPFLKHIFDEINFLLKVTEGLGYDDFTYDELLKRGCTRSIEIIGEATMERGSGDNPYEIVTHFIPM